MRNLKTTGGYLSRDGFSWSSTSNDAVERTGRWKKRKIFLRGMKGLRGKEKKNRCPEDEKIFWLVLDKEMKSFHVRSSELRERKKNILLWIPMANTCWYRTILSPGPAATWHTIKAAEFFFSFFFSFPCFLWLVVDRRLLKNQDHLHNRGHVNSEKQRRQ